jgi:hypothetical protein
MSSPLPKPAVARARYADNHASISSAGPMLTLYLIPPIIAFLLLAAHFFRSENLILALVCVLAIFLVLVRRPWAARTIQVCLVLGSVEWLHATISLILSRSQMGQPFLRLALILGGVTLFTALSSLVFQTAKLKGRFDLGQHRSGDKR